MMYQPNISKLRPDYMVYAICSETLQTKLLELAGGSTVGHIRVGDIRELPVPHPKSVEEQRVIAETLSAEADVIKEFEASSQKLHALKTALMQDLLTGKKRVTELLSDIKAVKHVEPKL
jgi:type I restriction enzyme S subunit